MARRAEEPIILRRVKVKVPWEKLHRISPKWDRNAAKTSSDLVSLKGFLLEQKIRTFLGKGLEINRPTL